MDQSVTWYDDDGKSNEHLPSHNLLQVRTVAHVRYGYHFRGQAQSWVDELDEEDADGGSSEASGDESNSEHESAVGGKSQEDDEQKPRVCVACSSKITPPFWYCLDCEGTFYRNLVIFIRLSFEFC